MNTNNKCYIKCYLLRDMGWKYDENGRGRKVGAK
jgi:hypothetical protein